MQFECFDKIEKWLKAIRIVNPKWEKSENTELQYKRLDCDFGSVSFVIMFYPKKVTNKYKVQLYRQCVIRQELADWFNDCEWYSQEDVVDWLKPRLKKKYVI